jgi:molybdenum cofactor biosynthesis enzyme MoaA
MSNFCAIPFGHLMVDTTGQYQVCCQHHITTDDKQYLGSTKPMTWWHGDYMTSVRDSFSQGKQHPGCASCWKQEENSQVSYRQRVKKEYQILGIKSDQTVNLVNAEIRLGNLCNLSCVMCNEVESSAFLAENIRLGINKMQPTDFRWSEQSWSDLDELLNSTEFRVLNFRGGEPFYNKALYEILDGMPEESCRTTVLHISTNATVWNDRWRDVLSKFRLVRVMLSIDAVGDLYEYIRYPAQWKDTERNVSEMLKCSNFKPMVHAVVQNLNISRIGELIDWCDNAGLYLELDQLRYPEHLQVDNLPQEQKQIAIQHLSKLLDRKNMPDSLNNSLYSVVNQFMLSTPNSAHWDKFKQDVGARDQLRGTDYRNFIQE